MVLGVGLVGLAVGLGCGCLGTFGCLLVLGVVFALNLLNVIGTSPPYARVAAMTSIKTNTILKMSKNLSQKSVILEEMCQF